MGQLQSVPSAGLPRTVKGSQGLPGLACCKRRQLEATGAQLDNGDSGVGGSKGPFIRPLEMEEPVRNAVKGAGGGIRAGFPQFLLANMNTYAPILRVSRSRLPRLERWFQKKRTKQEPHKQTMPQHPQGACVGGSKGDSAFGFSLSL